MIGYTLAPYILSTDLNIGGMKCRYNVEIVYTIQQSENERSPWSFFHHPFVDSTTTMKSHLFCAPYFSRNTLGVQVQYYYYYTSITITFSTNSNSIFMHMLPQM